MSDKEIKCVVWDLDHTLWDGVLSEFDNLRLRDGIRGILEEVDRRGILQSIASKNHYEDAMGKLREFGLDTYFLYPQIHWNSKSSSISRIQKELNIGLDTFLFVDDQVFEREEVKSVHPEVMCFDSHEYKRLLELPRMQPLLITKDSRRRRLMYLEDMQRKKDELEYEGPKEEFLAGLGMELTISEAREEDLERAEELTIRTNQLNSTGVIYSHEELKEMIHSENYRLFVCELTDKYGSYGKIGLILLHISPNVWNINLLLMSCRVMSRGVGTVLLHYIMREAKKAGVVLQADFVPTDKNRLMHIAYRFSNFKEVEVKRGKRVLENDLTLIHPVPDYIRVVIPENVLSNTNH